MGRRPKKDYDEAAVRDALRWKAERFESRGRAVTFLFQGGTVQRITAGCGITLLLDNWFRSRISLTCRFTVFVEGEAYSCSQDDEFWEAILIPIMGCALEDARTNKDGYLLLRFANGITIQAPEHAGGFAYEAWDVRDEDGFCVICAIGGDLAIWKPDVSMARMRRNDS